MPGTTSSEWPRETAPPQIQQSWAPRFKWWLAALLLGYVGVANGIASDVKMASPYSTILDGLTLAALGSSIALTVGLVLTCIVRGVRARSRSRSLPPVDGWLPGGHGAVKWLWTAGGFLVVTGVTGVVSAGTRGGLHRVMSAVASTGLFSLGLVLAGLVIWLVAALAIQLPRDLPGPWQPAYPGGPDVPPEPWAYMSQKWSRPGSALALGIFIAAGTVVFQISLFTGSSDEDSSAAAGLMLIFFATPMFAGAVFVIWTALRRMVWASRFKKVVGCSPWSKKLKELRARGDRNDTADI